MSIHPHVNVKFLSLLLVASILLSACNDASQSAQRPTAQPVPQVTIVSSNSQVQVGPASTPRPLGSPVLVDRSPGGGEELLPDKPIELTFDQPMDKASVESSVLIGGNPIANSLKLEWVADNVVRILPPQGGWQKGGAYDVSLNDTAKSAKGLGLARPAAFAISTIGFLSVAQTVPSDSAADVAADSPITLLFNRPVVPLTTASQTTLTKQAELPNPLIFDPPISGSGEWLNTSIYVFRPSTTLAGGTVYKGMVMAGLKDTTGAVLQNDYTWTFSAAGPVAKFSTPSEAMFDVDLRQPISITFSQKMDRAATEAAFSMEPAVKGTFSWADEARPEQNRGEQPTEIQVGKPPKPAGLGEVLVFTPDENYVRYQNYAVNVGTEAKSAMGGAALRSEFGLRFRALRNLAVQSTTPKNGENRAPASDGLRIQFSAPILPETVVPNLRFEPALTLTKAYTYYSEYDKSFFINTNLAPSTKYKVTIDKGIADKYGQTVTQPVTINFTTAPLPPYAYLSTNAQIGTYNANLPTQLFVSYRNVTKLEFELAQLSLEEFGKFAGQEGYKMFDSFVPTPTQVLRKWAAPTITSLNEGGLYKAQLNENGGALTPGVYLLSLSAPELAKLDANYKPQRHVLVVSALHLSLKRGEREALVWATGLRTGQPLTELNVSFRDKDFKEIGDARLSDAGDQLGQALLQVPSSVKPYDLLFATVAQPGDPLFGVVHSGMVNGINAYDYGLSSRYSNDPYYAYFYTDRPIYRPGQMVFFKGIVREDNDARYSLPLSLTSALVTVQSPQGQQVFSAALPITNGTIAGEFALDNAAASGSYYLQACLSLSSSLSPTSNSNSNSDCSYYGISFLVSTYRRPEFEVVLKADKADKADYKTGDTINATVDAKYFSGGNVQGAKVKWSLQARDFYFDRYDGPGYYAFGDYGDNFYFPGAGYNSLVSNSEGVTDASGAFAISVPASFKNKGSVRFSLEASVTDLNDQSVSARAEGVVHKGAFYLGIAPESYVANAGQEAQANIISVNWDGKLLPNQAGQVTIYKRQWFTAQEEDQFGNTQFTSVPSDTEVYSASIATGAEATTTVSFVPSEGGEYRFVVKSEDGNSVAATSVYVSSDNEFVAWRVNNNDRIDLKADKQTYQVGETAKILVPTPYQGGNVALLTVERGNFLERKTIVLNTNSDVLEIPITESMAPNAFVSVLMVSQPTAEVAPSFKLGYASFKVDPKAFALNVSITPDKAQYQPRDTATYDISVTDASGAPVQAELSVALVDKAVLSLAEPNSGKLLDSFYGLRGLSVRTADTLSVNVDRVTAAIDKEFKGGGGGGEASADANFVRQNFKDTAYWSAVVTTDAEGKARVSVTLPDNLTTWSLDARAVTSDTKVGEGKNEVLSTKLLLVRPVTPRFFVVGDEAVIGAVVNNNTDADVQTDVTLQASGVQLMGGAATQQVTVKAKGTARVDWTVKATTAISAELTMTAQGGGFVDSSIPGLATANGGIPILRYASPETVGTAGDIGEPGKKTEIIALPPRLETGMGQLSVQVDASLAAAAAQGLKALDEYPYESIDWVACRLMANVANVRFIKKTGLGDANGLQAKLDSLVTRGLQRLISEQHSDGGWGWWVTDESNTTLTANVVASMAMARDAGYTVDAGVMARAQEFLNSKLTSPALLSDAGKANRQAFILFALAQSNVPDGGRLGALFEVREKLSHYGRALLAMSLAKLDPSDARIKTLVSDLESAAVTSATGTSWVESSRDFENFYASTRSTSIILDALANLDPQNALVPNAVRWLMVARKADAWESVQENAWAVTALADWMIASGETNSNYDWRVTLNDESVLNGKATKENLAQSSSLQVQVVKLLKDQANQLVFERGAGTGRLYYTARLTAYLPVEDVKAVNRGIVVARKYESADCTPKPQQPCAAINSAKIGENVRVRLTIVAPSNLHYVALTDPFPAGTEAVDTSLKTSASVGDSAGLGFGFGGLYGWGWWWFSHTELRDDHTALFATYLPAGSYEYTYVLRPSIVGNFKVMPAHVEQTYFPEVFGRSDGGLFVVAR